MTLAIFAPRGGRKNACWGAYPNPANFGTKCPEVAALCALYLRPGANAPAPYFHARPSYRAGGRCCSWRPRPPASPAGPCGILRRGSFSFRPAPGGFFESIHLGELAPGQQVIHGRLRRPVGVKLGLVLSKILFTVSDRLIALKHGAFPGNHGPDVGGIVAFPQRGCPEPGGPVLPRNKERDHTAPPVFHRIPGLAHQPQERLKVGWLFCQRLTDSNTEPLLGGRGTLPDPLAVMEKAAPAVELGY